jgi:amidase
LLVSLGCIVEDAVPDFSGADEAFQTLRALAFATGREPLLATHRHLMKDTVVWNTEYGLALTGAQIANAYRLQAQVIASMRSFMQRYDMVVGPTTQVLAFDVNQPYVQEINGHQLPTYIDWMKSCWYITMTAHPAISIPCSMSHTGLPVGMQIVGRMHDDINLLRMAAAIEAAIDQTQFVPVLVK